MDMVTIEENYNRDMEYLNTQLEKINDKNVFNILIETITKLDSTLNEDDNNDLDFEEMDLLKMIHCIYSGMFGTDEIPTVYRLVEEIKMYLYEWIELSRQRHLENIVRD